MIYATSDLHGYSLSRFRALLDKAGFGEDDFLFILGDVIDRNGDGGIELLEWIMEQPNIQLLLGNHESMLLKCDFLFNEITDIALENLSMEQLNALLQWMSNGADPTMAALAKLNRRRPGAVRAVLDFLRDAPLYDTVSVGGRDFLLCHSGLDNFRPDKPLSKYTEGELVWARPSLEDCYFDDVITVFGHTPTVYLGSDPMRAVHTGTWICIDTGAAMGEPEAPMLLRLDDLKEFYAKD